MTKKPGTGARGSARQRADGGAPPPAPPPPAADSILSKLWRIVSGSPNWLKGLLGLIAAAGAAMTVIYSFLPADLELTITECRPELVKLEVTNGGGQTATLGDAAFEMVSTARFGNDSRNAMDEDALENPIRQRRTIARNEAASYEWPNVFLPEDAAEGETCHLYLTIPLLNDREKTFSADCACQAR